MRSLVFKAGLLIALLCFVSAKALSLQDSALWKTLDDRIAAYVSERVQQEIDNHAELLGSGRSIVFFFEGAGAEPSTDLRQYALCLVIREMDGQPEIVYANSHSSTIPDRPKDSSTNPDNEEKKTAGVATVPDGEYPITALTHKGNPSVKVGTSKGYVRVIRFMGRKRPNGYEGTSYGIRIHHRIADHIIRGSTNVSSAGCFLVGLIAEDQRDYTEFLRSLDVIGPNETYKSGKPDFGKDLGCVIVDRTLAEDYLIALYGKVGAMKLLNRQ